MGLIILVVFIAVSIVVYFYVTQITRPIKKITEITQQMAVEDDPNLRIPSGGKSVNTEVDASIESINAMYSSWMITKEKLAERSEFLLEQLHEKELEKKYREDFIAGTSHELKTPIAIIQGYAEGADKITDLNTAAIAEGTEEKVTEVEAALKDGSLHVFDTTTFTVNGSSLEEISRMPF